MTRRRRTAGRLVCRQAVAFRKSIDGQEKLVLCAGVRNFREPWARDFGFASFGLIELNEFQATKEGLEVFLLNQRPSGQRFIVTHVLDQPGQRWHRLWNRQVVNGPRGFGAVRWRGLILLYDRQDCCHEVYLASQPSSPSMGLPLSTSIIGRPCRV